jgi:hypothetical protein
MNYEKYNNDNYTKYYDTFFNYDLEGKDWEVSIDKLYNGPLVEVTSKNSHQSSLITDTLVGRKLIDQTPDYVTMDALAKSLGISTWTLGLITSSLFVVNCTDEDVISEDSKISELEHWNLGLSLKSRSKNEKLILPGFTRYIEDRNHGSDAFSWEFSDTAVELIRKYKEKYPFVFDCLEKYKTLYNRSDKFFRIYELFSNIENFFTKLTEIAVWINSLDIGTISFTSSKSTFLSFKDCNKIEEYLHNKNKTLKSSIDTTVTMVVNPNYIYQETLPWLPPFMAYEPTYFSLGDRVVNIRSNDLIFVPFGMKGTVTAVSNDFIEVLFDEDFIGGNNLDGRIKSNRGAKVKAINLINLTEYVFLIIFRKPPIFLRRNKNKYFSWDFQTEAGQYDGAYEYNLSLQKSKNTKSTKIKQNRVVEDTELKKHHSFNEEKKTSLQDKKIKIIKKSDLQESENVKNIQPENYQISPTEPSNMTTPINYVPKRIIVKDKGKINSNFKTNPEGAKISKETQIISNEKNSNTVENKHRENRIFSNESLPRNNLYYFNYNSTEISSKLKENKKVIIKF